jgi:DNA-binding response OmpR family regulator
MQEPAVRQKEAVRILFVDDEPNLRLLMPVVLRQHGYDVTAVDTVNEALSQIMRAQFDVLISELTIGHPGDGFTVVRAMRRAQPTCVTLILTGYTGFDSTLEAIRSHVDHYLIKPAAIPALIDLIEQKLKNPKPGTVTATKRISQVIRENKCEITQHTLKGIKSDPDLRAIPIPDEQRIELVPRILEDLATMLESSEPEQAERDAVHSATMRGIKLCEWGYTIPLLATHVHLVEQAIYEVIHEHLRSLNLSYFRFDLKHFNASLGIQLGHTQMAYLKAERRLKQQRKYQN